MAVTVTAYLYNPTTRRDVAAHSELPARRAPVDERLELEAILVRHELYESGKGAWHATPNDFTRLRQPITRTRSCWSCRARGKLAHSISKRSRRNFYLYCPRRN